MKGLTLKDVVSDMVFWTDERLLNYGFGRGQLEKIKEKAEKLWREGDKAAPGSLDQFFKIRWEGTE